MKFKKAIHLMLSAVMLSSFLGSFNVEADNSLFSAKYDFGAGKVCDGYTQIKADDKFDQTKGYGFSSVDGLSNGGSDVPDELKGDYVTSSSGEINFEVAVPDGDYEVKMLNGGDTATEVNIYINDGERVRVFTINANEYKENIQRVIPKDGKITFKFKGKDIKVNSIEITQLANRTEKGEKPTIYIAGDSTAQTYKDTDYPQAGWGQTVGRYFTNDVIVENRSIGGRSTKSYNNDGRLDNILTSIKPGDYIFIQFGHNDGSTKPERYISVEDFKTLLTEKYIGETVKRGAIPVLLTPTTRCEYDKTTGLFAETLADYSNAIREVAAKTGTVLIDINNDSRNLWNKLGFDVVKTYYFICEKGESVKYPEGTDDRTHFKKAGADAISKLVVKGVRSSIPALVSYTYDPDDMPAKDFSDMTGHWAKDTVAYMSKTGIVEGISDTEFAPDKEVTRAEFLTMAMRAAKINGKAWREGQCLDVASTDWFRFDVQGALDKGLLADGLISDGKFNANAPITREEMASILVRAAEFADSEYAKKLNTSIAISDFADFSSVSSWAADDMAKAYQYGFVNGINEQGALILAPQKTATRAQAATIIARYLMED